MSNVLKADKRESVLALGRLKWSTRQIADATGVNRETVTRYLRAAGIPIRLKGFRANPATQVESKPAMQVETPSWPPVRARRHTSKADAHREAIEGWLRDGRTATSMFQELVERHGFAGSYKSVWRLTVRLGTREPEQATGIIRTAPGEEAQVDYGEGPLVRHPVTGRYQRPRMFVMTLGHSRKSVWVLGWGSSSRKWCEYHQEAFRRLGGSPRLIVQDNLKEGVKEPDAYDPVLNPLYRAFLKHHGVTGIAARVRDPDRKGKVERAVDHAQLALRGMKFETLEEAQAFLDGWAERWADTRVHGTTKRRVDEAFAAERPHLLALPVEPFRFFEFGTRKVHPLDGCVEVAAAYYEAPPGMLGQHVDVQWDDHVVRLVNPQTGTLLVEHRRHKPGEHSLQFAHARKRPAPVASLLEKARGAGVGIGRACQLIHDRDGVAGVRRVQGVLRLCVRHGTPRVEHACVLVMAVGAPTYRNIKTVVEKLPPPGDLLTQVDPLIRQLTQYKAAIEARLQGEQS